MRGHALNGKTQTQLNNSSMLWNQSDTRLNNLIGDMSLLSRTPKFPENLTHPVDLRTFVEHRNKEILRILNEGLERFRNAVF